MAEEEKAAEVTQPLTTGEDENGEVPKVAILDDSQVKLKKEVSVLNGVGLVVGVMIGSGIFISPKGVLKQVDSVGLSLLIWAGCGLLSLFGSLCYCEMGTMIPKSGAEYSYLKHAFGPLPGFLYSWTLALIIRPSSIAIVSLTFARYVTQPFFPNCEISPLPVRKVLAAACIAVTIFINCGSVKWATRITDSFTLGKLVAIAILVIIGIITLAQGHVEHLQDPFEGSNTSPAAIGLAFYSGLWAYDGWNALNFVTEEMKNPARDLPRALMIGIPLVTICYLLTNIAYIAVVGGDGILSSGAVAMTVGDMKLGPMAWVIPIFVACSTFGCVNGLAFSGARLVYTAARNGHMPKLLAMIHTKRRTPMPSIIFMNVIALVMLIPDSSQFSTLVNYFSFAAWLSYFAVFVALIYLRWKEPDAKRPYRVWIIIPIVSALIALYLLITPFTKEPMESSLALFFILLGVPVYFIFSKYDLLGKCGFCAKFTYYLQTLCDLAVEENGVEEEED
ncbi:b(0,+)-type amino acid transporter 1 [Exaiptasia diaphana]|uniref:b(0,+)-type amino acid transporter 1 n=1 Tax=Exaiptasia diaphana TaxID=2652724 RepID=A0A913XJG3_EXADI|nr:b(0,+)-type amino acid transporter 1 [Exaiptasia diaphana]